MKLRPAVPPGDVQHPEDLSVLERRGQLSETQTRRLHMVLTASDTLRYSHRLGQDFDELVTASIGDAELVERAIASTCDRFCQGRRAQQRSARQVWLPWLGVVGALLASAAAGAALWPHARALFVAVLQPSAATPSPSAQNSRFSSKINGPASEAPKQPGGAAQTEAVTNATKLASSESRGDAVVAARLPQPLTSAGSADLGSTHPSTQTRESPGAPPKTAAELFSEANSARRNGEIERARTAYHALRATYPASNEATLSYVLLGRIDLQRHAARDALQQFERYLKQAHAGALAEEALEGKASCYRDLGMRVEEAAAWRELLSRYPHTVYQGAARNRLIDLR